MRKLVLIRWGVASVLVGGGVVGMLAAGCGSSSGGSSPNENDAGPDSSTGQPGDDSSPGDDTGTTPPSGDGGSVPEGGSADADAAVVVPPEHGKLILVHASTYAPPMRFCFGFVHGDAGSVTLAQVAAAPNTALGLPPGLGGPAADTAADLADQTIEVYGIVASALTSQTADAGSAELLCNQLIGASALPADGGGLGLVQGLNYWDLGQLPSGTIADGTTTLLAVVGCAPGNTTTQDVECPTGYNASTGDLGLWFKTLDRTTTASPDASAIGAQFADLSLPFQILASGVTGGLTSSTAGFYVTRLETVDAGTPDGGSDGGDAGDAAPVQIEVPGPTLPLVATGATYETFAPPTAIQVPGIAFDGTSGFFVDAVTPDGGAAGAFAVSLPLPTIRGLSFPSSDAGTFQNGSNYVFVLLGDPQQPSFIGADGGASTAGVGTFNPLSLHILGFPNDPPFGN
jgi:hypothetical protein